MLAFINKKIDYMRQIISLFYGPKYTRKQLADRFHEWRKSVNRDPAEKDKIIVDGSRSQVSVFSRQWKWIIVQALLWLIISFKFDFPPVINLMAFLTIFSQFSHNIMIISKDKRNIFNTFIAQEILSARSFSTLLWETLDELEKEKEAPVTVSATDYAPDCEWTDITLQLITNKYDHRLPFIKIIIGHESSDMLHPSGLGLVHSSDHRKQSPAFMMLKLFGRHSSFIFEGHSSQRASIEKQIQTLITIINTYFGSRDIDPIVQNNVTGSWECFINIDDRTNTWDQTEIQRGQDIDTILSEWNPLEEEPERIDQAAEDYKMKGYGW